MKKPIFLLAGLLYAYLGQAQQNFKTQSVSIFKNNTAFFIKSGEVRPNAEKAWLWQSDSLPQALSGTFWLASPSGDFGSVRSMLEDKSEQIVADSYLDMLDANDGKMVRLYLKDSLPLEGRIQIIKAGKDKSKQLYALVMQNKTLILSTTRLAELKQVEFLDAPNFSNERKSKTPTIRVDFKSAKASQPVELMYLQKGLLWQPEYLIELLTDTKAKINMRALITNDAEDIETQEMNLVAGVPNFKYATELTDFLKFLYPSSSTFRREAVDTYVDGVRVFGRNGIPDADIEPAQVVGESVEDLYYYPLKNIVLKKGERGIFDIFNQEVSVEHIYTTHLGNNAKDAESLYFGFQSSKVEHSIELINTTPFIWSAGAVMIAKNNLGKISPVCQDRLSYTSMKEKEKIFLTEAPDIMVSRTEKETNRNTDAKKINENGGVSYYDLVTVEGEVNIRNYKNKEVNLTTSYNILGTPLESSLPWEQTNLRVSEEGKDPFNLLKRVEWKQKVQAGAQIKINYKYKMYVFRYSEKK
jgi:hypothetical protein